MGLTRRNWLGGGLLLAAMAPLTARARAASAEGTPPDASVAGIREMRAGDFVWLPELAPAGPVLLVVSIRGQRAIVYRNGIPIGVSTVSTGKEGHETPTGVFTILQKKVDHKSNLYNNAPMPFMQRLTWDGIALHAGNLPGYPASHGCIRLPMEFARALYDITRLGMTVVVAGDEAVPRIAPTPKFLGQDEAGDATPAAEAASEWHPEASPTGPISIAVSAADRRIVVLRNGVRIGSAPVRVAGEVSSLGVFTLSGIDATGFHWLALGIPGASDAHAVTAEERARLQIPPTFLKQLRAILQPGVTAIVTPDSLSSGSSGQRLVVIDSEENEGE